MDCIRMNECTVLVFVRWAGCDGRSVHDPLGFLLGLEFGEPPARAWGRRYLSGKNGHEAQQRENELHTQHQIASLSECTFHDSAQNTSGSTRICVMMNYNHPVKSRLDNKIKMKVKIVKIQIV